MRTTAIFKCIVTLANGTHRIVRVTIDKVARIVSAVRELGSPWLNDRCQQTFRQMGISPKDFVSCRFLNERTGEELLSLSV